MINDTEAELDRLLTDVASAVGLQEGGAGVHQVLRAVQRLAPASTRSVSRQTGLPLPVVAAVNNELRARGVLTTQRPSRLTPRGQDLLGPSALDALGPAAPDLAALECAGCLGTGIAVPARFAGLLERLTALAQQAPAVDLTLDQSHCTPETKLRRVLFLLRHRLLPGADLVVVGDDDLMAVTVAAVGAELGHPLVRRLAVVDIAADVLAFTGAWLREFGVTAELVQQDLREPLAESLRGRFDLAMTDPPYTSEGARLFLSRAVEGLRPGPGRSIAFSFGPKGPRDSLLVQQAVTELGLTVQAMQRDFNAYAGAGVIAGHSHLQWLASTERTAPVVGGGYTGPLYTAEKRGADREYRCLGCGARHPVGPGGRWRSIAELKAAGCPDCGGHRLRPLRLVREGEQR